MQYNTKHLVIEINNSVLVNQTRDGDSAIN